MTRDQIRRARGKALPTLEALDERLAPAPIGLGAGAVHAAQVSKAKVKVKAKPKVNAHKPAAKPKVNANKPVVATTGTTKTNATGTPKAAPVTLKNPTPSTAPVTDGTPKTLSGAAAAKLGGGLTTIFNEYQKYVTEGAQGNFASSLGGMYSVVGNSVMVTITTRGDFESAVGVLSQNGAVVTTTSMAFNAVQARVPIDQLGTVATLAEVNSIRPVIGPMRG